MKFKAVVKEEALKDSELQVFFLRKQKKKVTGFPAGSKGDMLRKIVAAGDFKAKEEECLFFYNFEGKAKGKGRLLAVGLGEKKADSELWRRVGGAVAKAARQRGVSGMSLLLPEKVGEDEAAVESLVEGLVLGSYVFDKYKNYEEPDDAPKQIARVYLVGDQLSKIDRAAKRGQTGGTCSNLARDLGNEPANKLTPESFADFAAHVAQKSKLSIEVLGPKEMAKLRMGGILGVSQGSAQPPRMVVLEYRRNKDVSTVMLVGKGLTFDSGGISLKPGAGMEDMKYDMCGGAAVLAAMEAIGRERPGSCNVIGLIPLSENLPGPASIKPGDVVTIFGGKTVEVINTDAEGRLLLADALAYGIDRYKPDAVIDVATLTGAAIVALGHHRCALLCNDERLAKKVEKAGMQTGEPSWRLPLAAEYTKQMKSDIADLRNVGKGRDGGTITAAAFLQEFVGKIPWAHLDIAGTAWDFTEKSYIPKGPSGFGARTLLQLIRNWK